MQLPDPCRSELGTVSGSQMMAGSPAPESKAQAIRMEGPRSGPPSKVET